jgi:hypothetical protein
MTNRDPDPLESQVRILYGKNGGRCAYPECGVSLVMLNQHKGDQPKNVGKVAHITAASPGGPRYDASLTTPQRRSEWNLILLCGPHHDAIDTQLEFHTTVYLRDAKTKNEERVSRGYYYSIGSVGFDHLEIVCKGINIGPEAATPAAIDAIVLPIDTEEKIILNTLGAESRDLIQVGLARQAEVRAFIQAMDQIRVNFASDLAAGFKAIYYSAWVEGYRGDDLFRSVLGAAYENCGPRLTDQVGAAALAVVVELFVICEIFEHERTATR